MHQKEKTGASLINNFLIFRLSLLINLNGHLIPMTSAMGECAVVKWRFLFLPDCQLVTRVNITYVLATLHLECGLYSEKSTSEIH